MVSACFSQSSESWRSCETHFNSLSLPISTPSCWCSFCNQVTTIFGVTTGFFVTDFADILTRASIGSDVNLDGSRHVKYSLKFNCPQFLWTYEWIMNVNVNVARMYTWTFLKYTFPKCNTDASILKIVSCSALVNPRTSILACKSSKSFRSSLLFIVQFPPWKFHKSFSLYTHKANRPLPC